ncbi:MAG: GTP pyrophosphokinase family protein [Lachnospiraceae bacterium]|nr:GTP pyrophosphokinase family protein [Lachnospiraceae bacterium]MBR1650720.1 GTP pyrophosphokinase family protein [Lachnospiraceae bacterium]
MTDLNEFENNAEEIHLPNTIDYLDIEKQYRQLMFMHEAAIEQVTAKLNILKGEFQFSNDRNPISSICSRIKSKESIIDKMQKKGLPFTISALLENIKDIAGIRVICPFIEDVYFVARMLVKQPDIEVLEVKDYIREPKDNGYRSLHLIVSDRVNFSNVSRGVTVEIQIRTIAMDFWASTEHQLRYKKETNFTKEAHDKLKYCAELMAEADREIQNLAGDFDLNQW